MKGSSYKTYEELPLFLNAETVAKVLGVSPSSGYELMHEKDFPVLRVGNRMVVPKEQFVK
jgi:excisionase family DNA binding protein